MSAQEAIVSMRQLRLSITPYDPSAHPFCALTRQKGPIEEAQSLYCNKATNSQVTSVFAIKGEPEEIRTELDKLSEVVAYDLTDGEGDVCYMNGQIEMTGLIRTFNEIISRDYITLVLPVVYTKGSVSVELVGPDAALQDAVDALPSTVLVDLEWIGEFADGDAALSILSDRQREAVLTGLELGYYETPRDATHADVAERLGCSTSTASEHLLRAEAKLIKAMLNR